MYTPTYKYVIQSVQEQWNPTYILTAVAVSTSLHFTFVKIYKNLYKTCIGQATIKYINIVLVLSQ